MVTLRGDELTLDSKRPGDRTFEYEDRTVLVVDPKTAEKCDGRRLDYRQGKFFLV